jgi:RecJ-like exonuclease
MNARPMTLDEIKDLIQAQKPPCPHCDGEGQVHVSDTDDEGRAYDGWTRCTHCGGEPHQRPRDRGYERALMARENAVNLLAWLDRCVQRYPQQLSWDEYRMCLRAFDAVGSFVRKG